MAAPTRPAVVLDDDTRTAAYQSLDNVDEALYNSFRFVYERAVFQRFVAMRLASIADQQGVPFTDGNDIQVMWHAKPRGFMKKWKSKPRTHRPVTNAEPPVAPAVPPPAVPPPAVPPPAVPPHTNPPTIQAHAPTHQDQANAAATPQGPDSPETLALGSPLYVLENTTHYLSPTRGERDFVQIDLGDRGWKFVTVLYQTELNKDKARDRRSLHPRKNVLLYVRKNEFGIIEERLVVKRVDVSGSDERSWKRNEIKINRILAQTRCSHIIKYLGDGSRITEKKVLSWSNSTEEQLDTQEILHLYLEYAECGDLDETIKAHAARGVPIPEHFIWYFFSQIVEALTVFQQGICEHPHPEITGHAFHEPESPIDPDNWDPLLHSDIKDLNIFCCDGNPVYPSYPRPVLADFDIVQLTSNIKRHSGTPGWQAPERKHGTADDLAYAPNYWDVTVKADIWAVGLVAYKLLWAGNGTDAVEQQKREIMQDIHGWNETLPSDERQGLFEDLEHHPDIYSSGLIRLIQRCLHYEPESRPELLEMKNIADAQLRRLELLYGDEIKKVKEAIAEPHRVWSSAVGEPAKPFAIGSRHSSPRKRRRIDLDDGNLLAYQAIVDDWIVTMSSPQPSFASQAIIIEAMTNSADNSEDDEIRGLIDDGDLRHSFHYLISCLSTRVAPNAPVHHIREWGEGEKEAFMSVQDSLRKGIRYLEPVKQRVLALIGKIISEFRENRAYHDLQEPINVLEHAVKWSTALLQHDAEPRTPLLEKKTEMHRGFRDWIFIHPHPAESD